MTDKLSNHPAIDKSFDINQICAPLKQFNITYFAHVFVDNEGNFSAIGNNPQFAEVYLSNKYYNADIHLAKSNQFGKYVMWDAIELKSRSHQMHSDASLFGVKHTFTIIEKADNGTHFFHFANDEDSKSINQTYLSNLDLLQQFTLFFKENVYASKELSQAYDLKFRIDDRSEGFSFKSNHHIKNLNDQRFEFVKSITDDKKLFLPHHTKSAVLLHKETSKPVVLAEQQMKCFQLLIEGFPAKVIALKLNLSVRTVNHYLARIRKILGCSTSKEMVSSYKKLNLF